MGAIAIGLLVAVPLVMFGGILALITVLAVIWGVVQIVQGVGDLNTAKGLRTQRRLLSSTATERRSRIGLRVLTNLMQKTAERNQ